MKYQQQSQLSMECLLSQVKKLGNYIICKRALLGRGQFGDVYLAFQLDEHSSRLMIHKPLACKAINRDKLTESGIK
jgi:hypothetical protein